MALIKCSNCGADISDKAKVCPHCGNLKIVEKAKMTSNKMIRKILFIISMIILFIILAFSLIFLGNLVISISELNYPLTSVLPIILTLLIIGTSVLFGISMFRWMKGQQSKKYFKLFLILVGCSIFVLFITSPINEAIQKNNIGYVNQGESVYSVKGISYSIPSKWRTTETDNGYYHYPYVENSDGLLYVASYYDADYDFGDDEDMRECYQEFIEGMKSADSTEYFKINSQKSVEINGKDGFELKYNTIISGIYFECVQYTIMDTESNTMYVFTFGIKDSIPSDIEEEIENIMNSVKER